MEDGRLGVCACESCKKPPLLGHLSLHAREITAPAPTTVTPS